MWIVDAIVERLLLPMWAAPVIGGLLGGAFAVLAVRLVYGPATFGGAAKKPEANDGP